MIEKMQLNQSKVSRIYMYYRGNLVALCRIFIIPTLFLILTTRMEFGISPHDYLFYSLQTISLFRVRIIFKIFSLLQCIIPAIFRGNYIVQAVSEITTRIYMEETKTHT